MARGCYTRRPLAERLKLKESALAMGRGGMRTVDVAQALRLPRQTINTWLRAAGIVSAGRPRREPVVRQPRHLTSAFSRADALLEYLRDEADEWIRATWMDALRARAAGLQDGGKGVPVATGGGGDRSGAECPSSRLRVELEAIHA